jgi:hypothetical protein
MSQIMDPLYSTFLSGLGFDLIQPTMRLGRDGRFTVERSDGSTATLLELPGAPLDVVNTRLNPGPADLARLLRPLCDVPRMGTLALGAI